jgi:DNA-binding transcriptional LysR family regulator
MLRPEARCAARVGLSWQSGVHGILESHELARVAMQGLRYEASSVTGLQHMVHAGLGIAAVPALIARQMTGHSIVSHPLTPAVHRMVYLARRPGRSPTPAANEVVAETVRRLHDVGDRNIEPVANAASLIAIGFGDA